MKPPLSLKGRALQWLAQREHSRLELRRKLLQRLCDDHRRDGRPPEGEGDDGLPTDAAASSNHPDFEPEIEVDALLDWLQSHRYLSDERFVESRVHARAARYGNLRIRRELSQHGVALTSALDGDLRGSEQARAVEVQLRKFGGPPASLVERARQARFLASRGFSSDVVQKALRAPRGRDAAVTTAGEDASAARLHSVTDDDPD